MNSCDVAGRAICGGWQMFATIRKFMTLPMEQKLAVARDDESELWQGCGYYSFGQPEPRRLPASSANTRLDHRGKVSHMRRFLSLPS